MQIQGTDKLSHTNVLENGDIMFFYFHILSQYQSYKFYNVDKFDSGKNIVSLEK